MGRWQPRELRALDTLSDDLSEDMVCVVVKEPLSAPKARRGKLKRCMATARMSPIGTRNAKTVVQFNPLGVRQRSGARYLKRARPPSQRTRYFLAHFSSNSPFLSIIQTKIEVMNCEVYTSSILLTRLAHAGRRGCC